MTSSKENKYQKEIKDLILSAEDFLTDKDVISSQDDLNQIYSSIHKIDDTANQFGINTISNLFSPIEKYISNIIESESRLDSKIIASILSALNITTAILDDPSLSSPGIKNSYDSLKKQIAETFVEEDADMEEGSFSSNRFQEIFIEEANDLINQLEEKLLQLESEPEDDKLIDNVFRIMHTLKGNSNMFGFDNMGDITHHLENIYEEIRSGNLKINREILDITLQCIDHFRNLIEDPGLSDPANKDVQETMLQNFEDILTIEKTEVTASIEEAENQDSTSSVNTYYLFFKPHPDVFNDGSNPLFYVSDLRDYGECQIQPVKTDIPDDDTFNPEKSYISWHILLATTDSKENILDNFMFLNAESQPNISKIARNNKTKDQKYIDILQSGAEINESIAGSFGISIRPDKKERKTIAEKQRQVKSQSTSDAAVASIRVASAKIDQMMNLISELVTKQAELTMISGENEIPQLKELAESIESISRDLRDNAFSISLIPLEKSVLRFQRLVRDVSSKFNKKVNFVVDGKETELDKTVIEKIVDPIMHILRNSIDHGIETPEERLKSGKPEQGTIRLKAYPSGAHVVIEISDDGEGINLDKVKKTAVKKGYIGPKDDLNKDEMLKLILSPGFSTTENISEVSGRGVGMDVVSQKIMEIRGELQIDTQKGIGTTITIKLPLTISIIDSLLVMLGSTYYLIPLSVVERCHEVPTATITESKTEYLNLDGRYIPFIDLYKEFSVEEERDSFQRLILVNHRDLTVAIVVDQIVGNHQAVLKTLGYMFKKQETISGASILGNGEVALVLDTNRLVIDFMSNKADQIERINKLNMTV